ncbi:MAG: aspartate--tRNA ligase [bacterium]
MQEKRTMISEAADKIGQKLNLAGWVDTRRDHGKIIFIDLRDRSGIIQIVFSPENGELYKKAVALRPEWVISIAGEVKDRPKGMINEKIATGKIEISAEEIEVLSQAKTLPFDISGDGYEINEEKRLEYRYLDLRRNRMKRNLILRDTIIQHMRQALSRDGFVEVETPILTKSTPEGARDYVVPSRLQPGKFYALPQSPQQYKQLLMVGGLEKYFQFARCFRDEDTRGDRQPEFTQLDLEMSFVRREDVMDLTENLLIDTVKILFPEKKIQEIPFPRISCEDATKESGNDRPDLRKDKNNPDLLAFCWVTDFPFFEKDEKSPGGWTFTHNPFSAPIPEHKNMLLNKENMGEIFTSQYDIVLNGFEIGGGSIRNHEPETLEKVFEILGHEKEKIAEKFGHMMEAFSYGAPPHGGIALGMDRIFAILLNEPNIREVMAFPKTGDARDPMMGSPSEIDEKQLKELHLKSPK